MRTLTKIQKKIKSVGISYKEANLPIAALQLVEGFVRIKKLRQKLDFKIQVMIKNKLKAELSDLIAKEKSNSHVCAESIKDSPNIWVFWAQGWNQAPEVVRQCQTALYIMRGV